MRDDLINITGQLIRKQLLPNEVVYTSIILLSDVPLHIPLHEKNSSDSNIFLQFSLKLASMKIFWALQSVI